MNIGWPDLGGALLFVLGGLLLLGGLIGFVGWEARRRKSPAVMLEVAAAIARVWVVVTAIAIVVTTWRWLSGGDTWIADLPLALVWPETLPCETSVPPEPTTTALVCAHVGSADATIALLSLGPRLVLALGEILALVVAAVPGIVVIVACRQGLKGVPFARSVSRTMLISAFVVLAAGIGAGIASSTGRAIAATEVLPPPSSGADVTTTGIYYVSVDLWPIAAAVVLAALAAVFRHGERLHHDTEALV